MTVLTASACIATEKKVENFTQSLAKNYMCRVWSTEKMSAPDFPREHYHMYSKTVSGFVVRKSPQDMVLVVELDLCGR